ncbi:uncharacterized protein LOC116256776 [Nymphaea colorata]|nr:uncharacterized protein LOC116256776 [Nymphaea colorata]
MVAVGVTSASLVRPSTCHTYFLPYIHGRFILRCFSSFAPSSNPRLTRPQQRLGRSKTLYLASAMESSSSQPSQQTTPGDVSNGGNFYNLLESHQEKAARLSPVDEVRTMLDNNLRGVLSTFSQKHEGYPSGSLVDFTCDGSGSPILSISSLSVHMKNLMSNPKCCLLVTRDPEDKSELVVTLYGDAIFVPEEKRDVVRSLYLKRHPEAFWVDFGDFKFMTIEPKAVHYVSGVATAFLRSGEFTGEEYKAAKVDQISQFSKPISSHMNRDHADDTKAIVQYSTSIKVEFAHMLDVDSHGFNVKAGYQGNTFVLRIPFPRRAVDRKDVKNLIVEMLQSAKSAGLPT